jgi:ABC-type Mn2+/Zn2+ transport system ATPase subunit
MSLISRVEVTNYLTEGINSNRRVADWSPMLTGITLRMDGGRSTLVNMTNGAGKTSLVELLMYVLSRDGRLLKRLRDKVAPKSRGFTHCTN